MYTVARLRLDKMRKIRGGDLSLSHLVTIRASSNVSVFRASGVVGAFRATGIEGAFRASEVNKTYRASGVVYAFRASDVVGVVDVGIPLILVVSISVGLAVAIDFGVYWSRRELYLHGSCRCFVAGSTR